MAVTIGEKRFLEINVQGEKESYKVPLLGSLPLAAHKKLAACKDDKTGELATQWFIDLFTEYTSEEFVNSLTMDDMKAIMSAWKAESEAVSGVSMGE